MKTLEIKAIPVFTYECMDRGFGLCNTPVEMIPRLNLTEKLKHAFMDEPASQHISMITGIRGSGKTVFMTRVAKQIAENPKWTVVELSPEQDLLDALLAQLQKDKTVLRFLKSAQINLPFSSVELKAEGTPEMKHPEILLEKILENMKKRGRKLLITIDEVTNNPNVRLFASIFQILLRKDLPLYLLMTGLYDNLRALQNEKSLTFLYRAPRITLESLNLGTIADSYQRIFRIEREPAVEMARDTRGYSFAFQVLGYFTWLYGDDPVKVRTFYRQYLYEYVYDKVWEEMSATDRRVLSAMTHVPGGEVKKIRDELNMETNKFNPYRMRLIRKGVVDGTCYGKLRFTLPLFEDYIRENGYMEDVE